VFVIKSDGVYTYTFNHANQLVSASGAGTTVSYSYNGQGDRVSQTVGITTTTYTLDLAAGLTQVLADGTDTYLYGNRRIAQYSDSGAQYFLGDALGSVRQLVDANGEVLLSQSYEPFGEVLASVGEGESSYGFAAEMQEPTGLIYLRARFYSSSQGRFISKDTWPGDDNRPLSLNGWNYVEADPINELDPSGRCLDADMDGKCDPGWQCTRISDPIAREQCFQTRCAEYILPWKKDPAYDPRTKSIHPWSTLNQTLREERSEKVWNWICSTGGWWGNGCHTPYSLSIFLLWREGGALYNPITQHAKENVGGKAAKGGEIMVRLFKYIFSDGITKNDLSRFTGFFDPKAGSGFNMEDWEFLVSAKYAYYHTVFKGYVDEHWNKGPYMKDGHVVDRFWDSKESYPCSGCNEVHKVYIPPLGENKSYWFYFGYLP
jgi:RHS repeat-associated protein